MFDYQYMELAVEQAKIAQKNGEVPIGAVIVSENNRPLSKLVCGEKSLGEAQASTAEYLDVFEEHKPASTTKLPSEIKLRKKSNVVASAYNMTIMLNDPTAHAEILAIRQACKLLSTSRLCDSDIYVTLEPCPMCAQAISFTGMRRLYFGAYNPKGGGVENGAKIFQFCNHVPEVFGGILEAECAFLLKDFFEGLRDA